MGFSLESSAVGPLQQSGRKGSKKVRTGCITCKIRKVKCDEIKPFCMRCIKSGRKCDGYLDPRSMAQRRRRFGGHEPHMSLPPSYEGANVDEKRSFHFFQHVTAPALSGDYDAVFWRVVVLQICQTEPAVRHAVLAVSSLHEGMMQKSGGAGGTVAGGPDPSPADGGSRQSFALHQYNKAIASLLGQMRKNGSNPLTPLLTCVLFVCIEYMQNKDKEALIHLEQGRQILSQLESDTISKTNPETDMITQHLVPMYTRLSLTSFMLGGNPVPIPLQLKTVTQIPSSFASIDEARYCLYDLMEETMRFTQRARPIKCAADTPYETLQLFEEEQEDLLRKVKRFDVGLSLYQATSPQDAPINAVSLLRMHMKCSLVWISAALSNIETVYDAHLSTFASMIPLATAFIDGVDKTRGGPGSLPQVATVGDETIRRRQPAAFSFEMHVIAPLFFVAIKCRHPLVRRAALDLLRRNPTRRENVWRADTMAAIAAHTMHVEERSARQDRGESVTPVAGVSGALSPSGIAPELMWNPSMQNAEFSGADFAFATAADMPSLQWLEPKDPLSAGTEESPLLQMSLSGDEESQVNLGFELSDLDLDLGLDIDIPIDPNLMLDGTAGEHSSPAYSFSYPESQASSIDDLNKVPYRLTTSEPSSGPVSRSLRLGPPPSQTWPLSGSFDRTPSIHLEPPTPDPTSINVRARSASAHTAASPVTTTAAGTAAAAAAATTAFVYQVTSSPPPAPPSERSSARSRSPSGWVPRTALAEAVGLSTEAPFDLPERVRVHDAIIGPEREDGCWVMVFQKLGGLNAEWDVRTEFVATGPVAVAASG